MASHNQDEKHNHLVPQSSPQQQQQQGTPPSTPPSTPPPPFSQPDHAGLQVIETGLEVAGSDQSESLSAGSYPSSDPLSCPPWRYAEQKGYDWNGAPPPQVVPIEHQAGRFTGHPDQQQQRQYLGGHNPYDPAAGRKPAKKPICGLKRKLFWGVVGVAVLVIILAVAVGLGVGLAVRNSSGTSTSSSAASATLITLPAATATATAAANSTIQCPSANLTLYGLAGDDTANTDTKYLVMCGRDYSSEDGAIDIDQVGASFRGCLSKCGDTDGCVAVGWGNYYGTDTCWLKSQIGTPNWSSNWYSAVLQN